MKQHLENSICYDSENARFGTFYETINVKKEYERIAAMLRIKFGPALATKDPKAVEVVIILTLSLLMGWDTVSEVAERLGLPKTEIYGRLKSLNLHDWQTLFACAFEDLAIKALKDAQSQSDATYSRQQVVLAIDDSVIRRWGQLIELSWQLVEWAVSPPPARSRHCDGCSQDRLSGDPRAVSDHELQETAPPKSGCYSQAIG